MNRLKLRCSLLFAAIALATVASPTLANPPADSPMARGEHPRLFFTQKDLPAIRQRIAALYRQEFQEFLNTLADPSETLKRNQLKIETHWGAVNYAFVAVLDPAALRALGFSLPAAFQTSEQLCATSLGYASELAPRIKTGANTGHSALSAGYPNPIHLAAVLAYDWCHSYASTAQKTEIADAFVSVFDAEYVGKSHGNMAFGSNNWLANNQNASVIHDLLGIVAFYGDPYPSRAVQQNMYRAFEAIWIDRLFFELNRLYGASSGWHEGPGSYFQEGYLNLGIPVKMFGPALGVDYFGNAPFFTEAPEFVNAIVIPHSKSRACGPRDTTPCPVYLQRFGDIAGGIAKPPCKALTFMAGALRTSAPEKSRLAKWLYDDLSPGCDKVVTGDGGPWSNAVLYWFLFGDRDVQGNGRAPVEKLGLGLYSFQNNDTSQVALFAQPFAMYGHGSQAEGHFTIHKYGDLLLRPGNAKGGDARINGNGANLFHNSIGIHKGGTDKSLQHDGNTNDEPFKARGLGMRRTGEVKAETLARPFSYVYYDASKAWAPSTASVAEREFVYLKGPENSEYVITFDRVRVGAPAVQTKIWKAWVPAEPKFVGGRVSKPRPTKWVGANTDTIEVTNEQHDLKTRNFESAPAHGRLFLRSLAPEDATLSFLGGPDGEFQSGDDDGATVGGDYDRMTDAMRAYLGWGRIEIRPGGKRDYDTFLIAMQLGDSRTLAAMTPTVKLRSTDAAATGVHVRDAANEWVVMFAEDHRQVFNLADVTYTFQPVAGKSSHLLVNMIPGREYFITQSTGSAGRSIRVTTATVPGATRVAASRAGVLFFELSGASLVAAAPPAAPLGLRIAQ